jgi:hypothetical protein
LRVGLGLVLLLALISFAVSNKIKLY